MNISSILPSVSAGISPVNTNQNELTATPVKSSIIVKFSEAGMEASTKTTSNATVEHFNNLPSAAIPEDLQAQLSDISSRQQQLLSRIEPSLGFGGRFNPSGGDSIDLVLNGDHNAVIRATQDHADRASAYLDLAESINDDALPAFLSFASHSDTLKTLEKLEPEDRSDFIKLAGGLSKFEYENKGVGDTTIEMLNQLMNDMSAESQHEFLQISQEHIPEQNYSNGTNITGKPDLNTRNLIMSFNNSSDIEALLDLNIKMKEQNPEVRSADLLQVLRDAGTEVDTVVALLNKTAPEDMKMNIDALLKLGLDEAKIIKTDMSAKQINALKAYTDTASSEGKISQLAHLINAGDSIKL